MGKKDKDNAEYYKGLWQKYFELHDEAMMTLDGYRENALRQEKQINELREQIHRNNEMIAEYDKFMNGVLNVVHEYENEVLDKVLAEADQDLKEGRTVSFITSERNCCGSEGCVQGSA